MTPPLPAALQLACDVALLMLLAALLLALVRLARGPSLADRVVALDLIAVVAVGYVAVEALRSGQPILLRTALVIGLLGFLTSVAFAYHLKRRNQP